MFRIHNSQETNSRGFCHDANVLDVICLQKRVGGQVEASLGQDWVNPVITRLDALQRAR